MSSDGGAELIACLDVLWDELQYRITEDGTPAGPTLDELLTALWQIPELVWRMADELAQAHRVIDDVVAEQVAARQKAQAILREALGAP